MAILATYALCSVEDVKEILGIDSGDHSKDNLIIRKINMATEMIESYCNLSYGHHFKETTYTDEVYDGYNGLEMVLRMYPVSVLTSFSFRESSENTNNWQVIDTEDYFPNLNRGVINGYPGGTRFSSFRVTYTAGFSTIPWDLAEACATVAAYYIENSTSGTTVKRKQEGQREIEYFPIAGSSSSGSSGDTIIEQLNLDGVLNRYVMYVFV